MIYSPESIDGANASMEVARGFVQFKDKYPFLSQWRFVDFGSVKFAVQGLGTQIPAETRTWDIPEKPGARSGRLPDASKRW